MVYNHFKSLGYEDRNIHIIMKHIPERERSDTFNSEYLITFTQFGISINYLYKDEWGLWGVILDSWLKNHQRGIFLKIRGRIIIFFKPNSLCDPLASFDLDVLKNPCLKQITSTFFLIHISISLWSNLDGIWLFYINRHVRLVPKDERCPEISSFEALWSRWQARHIGRWPIHPQYGPTTQWNRSLTWPLPKRKGCIPQV